MRKLIASVLLGLFIAPASADPYAALLSFTPHNFEAVYIAGKLRYQR